MKKEEMIVYDQKLGINGTIPWLVDTAVRYSGDYSDEALDMISRRAQELGFDRDTVRIPQLVKAARQREKRIPATLPLEEMQIDRLRGGKIGFSETEDYGELEIREESGKVLITVTGSDSEGFFTAAGAYSLEEFMAAEGRWLETAVGEILFMGKVYEQQEEFNGAASQPVPEGWEGTDLFRISKEHAGACVDAWGGYIGKNDGFTPFGWTMTIGDREFFFGLDGRLIKEKAL